MSVTLVKRVKVKYLYLFKTGNRSTWRKPAMLGRFKLDNALLTCDQGNFNLITARSRNRTLVTVVRGTCTTTVPPATHKLVIVN